MPGEAGVGEPDMLARLVLDVGNEQDLGVAGQQVFLDDVDLERAKAAAERDMPLVGQRLVAEDDDDVVVKGALDLGEGLAVRLPRQIVFDLGAAGGPALFDGRPHPSPSPSA